LVPIVYEEPNTERPEFFWNLKIAASALPAMASLLSPGFTIALRCFVANRVGVLVLLRDECDGVSAPLFDELAYARYRAGTTNPRGGRTAGH
jgi:hypothetical protein